MLHFLVETNEIRNAPEVQWLGLYTFTARNLNSAGQSHSLLSFFLL